jgi:hypothetical protein
MKPYISILVVAIASFVVNGCSSPNTDGSPAGPNSSLDISLTDARQALIDLFDTPQHDNLRPFVLVLKTRPDTFQEELSIPGYCLMVNLVEHRFTLLHLVAEDMDWEYGGVFYRDSAGSWHAEITMEGERRK